MKMRGLASGAAVVLAAALPAPAAFQIGPSLWAARGLLEAPRAVVALDDDCYLVQCLDALGRSQVAHVRIGTRAEEAGTWSVCAARLDFPEAWTLLAGSRDRFVLAHASGDLSRCAVRETEAGVVLGPPAPLLDWNLRQAAGVGAARPGSGAELPDGSLVLGYGRAVLHLVPEEPAGPGRGGRAASWRWLVGQGAKSEPGSWDLLVTGDGVGQALLLDPQEQRLTRVDPASGKEEILATGACWPRPDLVPVAIRGCGDTVFVAAQLGGARSERTLVVVEPFPGGAPGQPAPYRAWLPGIGMDPRGAFAVTPAGHVVVSEPFVRGVRLVRNAQAAGGPLPLAVPAGLQDLQAALGLPAGTGAPPAPKPSPARPPKARPEPATGDQAKADRAFAALMAEEKAAARKRARKASRKSRPRPQPGPQPRAAAAAPRPAPAPAPLTCWILPIGVAEQRSFAGRAAAFAGGSGFRAGFGEWAAGQEAPGEGEPTVARLLAGAGRGAPLVPPRPAPRGLGAFALSRPALERAVRWMLRHAAEANPDAECRAWRQAGGAGHPGFSFGMYRLPGQDRRATLEIRDLQAFAARIDGAGGGPVLARELAVTRGITGYRTRADGTVRFAYGLSVVVGEGWRVLASVRPDGATRTELAPATVPIAAPPPPVAVPIAAPPAPRPFRLNPRAPEFVMPGTAAADQAKAKAP